MGQQLKPSVNFPKIEWAEYKKDSNNLHIYKSVNGLLAEKRQLTQDKRIQTQQQLKIYHQRSFTRLPLVKVFSALIKQQKKNFCSTSQKIQLYLQYIPNRLQKIKPFSLTEPQCVYLLQQTLKAFHQLFQKFGYFQIKADLIGFNIHGHLRCWLNKDFANNRVQNSMNSILSGNQYATIRDIDTRLKQTLQKGMVCDLWNTIKKKSNIQSRDLFYRLAGLENTTFQNAKKLIQLLIQKYQFTLPECLLFENCLQFKNNMHKQYNYGQVYNSENSRLKVVQIMQNEVLRSGTFNFKPEQNDVNFKDFQSYKEHIENRNKKTQNTCRVSISFEQCLPRNMKQMKNIKGPQKHINQINSPRRMLKIVDRTFDINLCSNLRSPSKNTIVETEPTQKKIQSDENFFLPLNTIQRQTSIVLPNIVSQKYILADIQSNLPSSRIDIHQQKQLRSPVGEKNILPQENRQPIFIQQYQPVFKRTSSRFIPPPPVLGHPQRQQIGKVESKLDKSPQFVKINHY